ncbi:MAG: RecBCD enzyme subunit RecD [Flavobacteriales bacterium]|nr:RecBCD enzyme subunit RecD [Flavobacteriales bacterium]
MNLYHLNTGVDSRVLLNADYDIRRYTDFISNAIKFLEKETLFIKVKKHIAETETIVNGEKKITKETRYIPEPAKNKREEKAIEILFNENARNIFDQNKDFKSGSIRIIDQNEDENYIVLADDIEGDTIFLNPDTYQLRQQKQALDNLRHRPLKEHYPLLNLFGFPDSQVWSQRFYGQDFDWTILNDESKDGVYEQREFVSKAFLSKDFALMEGPPGSGKTTTIIELIMQFASQGKRILLCSATHAAVDNVIERIKGRYKEVCDKEIIPVRISRFEQPVKESVRPYLLRNLVNTYKSEIEKHLKKNNTLDSQKYLLENINSKSEQDPIEKIILDSANVVAGTMIGILQHPDIRANRQGASFDVLIVDEASKVTFSDFIVPALYAKKWILVGDVKQLSPYVENDYVSENIASMLGEAQQQAIVKQFELKVKLADKRFDECLKIFFTETDINNDFHSIKSEYPHLHILKIDNTTDEKQILEINTADVLICMNSGKVKEFLSKNLFVKSIVINGSFKRDFDFTFRQHYIHKRELSEFTSKDEEWAEMVSSRLNQSFSFRNAGEEFSNIDKELNYLIPNKIKGEVYQIRRLVFPSILELLQNGVGKGEGQRNDRVLSDGFNRTHKQSRFTSLSYQHRMHPDIAKTSRENFYENNLQSANTVKENRGWNYALNEPVVKWIHNNDKTGNIKGNKIINPTEVNDIEKELLKFLAWAKNNPKPDGEHYEVAVLTFYLNQESELRRRIRKITKQSNFSKFHKDNTDIFLYTVDKFQGQEADLVLLSFTKFTRDAHFNSPNRLNVALTRARFKLVLFGNKEWFKRSAKLKALRDLATNFESIIRYEK